MNQIIRELKRQAAGQRLGPEQLKALIRAGYVYRNGDEHFLTDKGRDALAQLGVQPGDTTLADDHPPLTADCYPPAHGLAFGSTRSTPPQPPGEPSGAGVDPPFRLTNWSRGSESRLRALRDCFLNEVHQCKRKQRCPDDDVS